MPGIASASEMPSEVPSARFNGMCSTATNNGASRKPPLLASRPDTNATAATVATTRSRDGSGTDSAAGSLRRLRSQQHAQREREHEQLAAEHERLTRYPAA